ncbi:hypothetical protein CYPRO_0514 [Cyclonatronum proteinivorum]|uniref:Uncharacterized protein n=1 Tax=Cyclonatronum proteinivorum TaxID=1457365 RepID=A0A345UH48_9BACT|nr:hypothetical protein [Cyclonatronum proteinivorum]AXI99799.1 hypothetical protein CYPRO_0514 [Cyclonatronum proteinivorum]
MKYILTERYFYIQFKTEKDRLFLKRADRFAFLNAWRACFTSKIKTCSYALVPGCFGVIIGLNANDAEANEVLFHVSTKVRERFIGVISKTDLEDFVKHARIEELVTEKECVYRAFDLHTMPQRYNVSTDYRSYPFSSYLALATGRPSSLDQKTVWNWFGGRSRFSLFHQAYYGWVQPDVMIGRS